MHAAQPIPPQWVGLKFFNVYGPNEYHKGDMRSVVCKAYPAAAAGRPARLFRSHHPDYPDGGQKRDFVHVRDCVEVMLWLRENPHVSGLYNLGTGRAQTWLELMGALYGALGRGLEGYPRPFLSVEEGVRDYVNGFLAAADPYR